MRDFDEQSGYDLTLDILQESPPQAMFAANMDVQLGVLRAVRAKGVRVPDELLLSGFDDLPYAAPFSPVSAVVAQQTRMIGVNAAQLLLDKLEGKRQPADHQTVVLQPELIVRTPVGAERGVTSHLPSRTLA